jgi:hypothetical protein
MEKKPGLYLAMLGAVYLYGSVCAASRRNFFFDEIITSYLAELPDIRQIWPLIAKGIELNPPLPFWIAWGVRHSIGGGEILSRLPAIFGYGLMCFSLYRFVGRRCGTVFGFVALLLPLFTYPAWDSAVARGYGLMLGMSGLAILSWQLATDRIRRPLSLAGVAIGLAGAVSCHYYAVYVAGAIAMGELFRTREQRRIDGAVWLALAAGVSPLAVFAPLLRSASVGALKHFWVSPLPRFLYESYADLLGPAMMVFLLLLVLALWRGRDDAVQCAEEQVTGGLLRHEIVVSFILLAMPLMVYLAGVFGNVPFYSRYVQPVTIGFCIILPAFAHRIWGGDVRGRQFLISLMVWLCLFPWAFWQTCKVVVSAPPGVYLASYLSSSAGPLPLVFDSEADYLEYFYYAAPGARRNMFWLLNPGASIQFRGSDTGQRSLAVAQTFRDLHVVDYREFLENRLEFRVIRLHEEGWVVQSLLTDGANVRLESLTKPLGYFVDSTSVFHVTAAGRSR